MAERELLITLKMDRTQAEKEATKFYEGQKNRIAKTLSDAEVAEKAHTAFIKRENEQRVQLAAKAAKTEIELEKEIAENTKRLGKEAAEALAKLERERAAEAKRVAKQTAADQAKAIKDAEKIIQDAARETAAERKRQAREVNAEEKRLLKDIERAASESAKAEAEDRRQWDKRSLTETEAIERARSDLIRKENKGRVQALTQAHGEERTGLSRITAAWGEKGGAIGSAAKAVGAYAAAFSVVGAGVTVLNALDDKWRAISKGAMDAAKATAEVARNHLELSGFSGTPGQTAAEQQKTMGLVAASGLSVDQATGLRTAAESGAYAILDREAMPAAGGMPAVAAKQGLMSREEFGKAQVQAARVAAYSGGNAADYGQAVAMIPALNGRRMSADEVGGELVKMDRMATVGEYATPSDLIQQVKSIQGYIKSGVVSAQEGAALTALAGKTNNAAAGTLVKQGINAVSAGTLMDRGVHIDEDMREQYSTSADYFKTIGIERNANISDASARISDDLRKQPKGTNLDQYLLQKGITNQESRQWFLAFNGDREVWEQDLKPLMTAQVGPEAIDQTWQGHIKNDPVGRERIAEAGQDLASNIVGQRTMSMRQLMMAEHSKLVARGEAAPGSFDEYAAPMGMNPFTNIGRQVTGIKPNALLGPIAGRVTTEMARLNLSTDLGSDNDGTRSSIYDELTGPGSMEYKSGILNRAQAAIQGAGGDPTVGGLEQLKSMAGNSELMLQVLQDIKANTARGTTAAPGGGRPVPPKQP